MKTRITFFFAVLIGLFSISSCQEQYIAQVTELKLVRLTPAYASEGDIIKILGRNFSDKFGENKVSFGNIDAKVLEYNPWDLTVVVPENENPSETVCEVTVSTPKGTTGGLKFEYIPKPKHKYTVTNVAGGSRGHEDGIGTTARFTFPEGLAFSPDQKSLYIIQRGPEKFAIRTMDEMGVVRTIVAQDPLLNFPWHGSFNSDGDLLIANKAADNIIKMDKSGKIDLVQVENMELNSPMDVEFDPDYNMWVASRDNHLVYKIVDSSIAAKYEIYSPTCLSADDRGNIFVGSDESGYVHMIDKDGNVSNVAGIGVKQSDSNPDGLASKATIGFINGIHVAKNGVIFLADITHQSVRILTPDKNKDYTKGVVETIAEGFYPNDVIVNNNCDKVYVSSIDPLYNIKRITMLY